MAEITIIPISLLDFNKGQLSGLPKNPRFFRDYRYEAMKKSIAESPEMLELRELIVYPYAEGRYLVVCGNLRLRACKELGYKELPCKVLDPETDVKKLREYATKDNVSFGENDKDVMLNEWDKDELQGWGVDLVVSPKFNSKTGDRIGYFWRWPQRTDVIDNKTYRTFEGALSAGISAVLEPFKEYLNENP